MDDAVNLLQDHHFVGTLINSLPCGFIVLDEDGRVQAMNNVMERVLGISRQTAIGKKKGEVLRCIHLFEGTVGCGYTEDCSDCDTRKLALSAITENRKQTAGTYLQLLYYRLCVMPITLPPLRERREDIPLLSDHFLTQFAGQPGLRQVTLSSEALSLLMAHTWPGNVRELQNVLQCAIIRCQREVIEPEHLPMALSGNPSGRYRKSTLREQEVTLAMKKAGGNKSRAAELLGVSRSTLYRFFNRQKQTM